MKSEVLKNLSGLADRINMTIDEKDGLENFVMGKILSEMPDKEERMPIWLKLANNLVPANFALQPAAVFSLIAGLFLITSFASVNASKNSLPGDTLYPLKLTAESLRYNLSFSNQGRAKAAMNMAENRVGELKVIAGHITLNSGEKKIKIAKAAVEIKNNLNLVANKLQAIAPDVSSDEADAIKEIDAKLTAVKSELKQVGAAMGREESDEVQLAEAEAEKASVVALTVLDNEKENQKDDEQIETNNTSTPEVVIGQKTATSTNTSSEYILPLIIEQETVKEEFKVKLE